MLPTDLHKAARDIFTGALRAVDALEATRGAVKVAGPYLRILQTEFTISGRQLYAIAIGKAAPAMAMGISEILGDRLTQGLITGLPLPPHDLPNLYRWQVFRGGHPLPNEQSLAAAQAAFELLRKADEERALVIFLLSGGGSAMLEWPRDNRITLEELRETNRQLVACGASIAGINEVRRAFSAVKGGALSRLAPRADQITLIVSDTNPGDEANVASGPTLQPSGKPAGAEEILQRYGLEASLPASVLNAIRAHPSLQREMVKHHPHYVLLSNDTAIQAAAETAKQLDLAVRIAADIREQPIGQGCGLLLSQLDMLLSDGREKRPVCLISGGEFSCPVSGSGVGGRNLETVLRCAIELGQGNKARHKLVLSLGTDGIDGNSPAAGAVADETTMARAGSLGLAPISFLDRSDSFTFFNKLDDALITGPTGTNVRDLRILLAM